jgi:putative MATE family efflux protein
MEMALPMTVAQTLNLLYNIVDRIYIGRIPGTSAMALTGVGLCLPVITFISAFSRLFGAGGAPLCSMAIGRGDAEEAERIMGTSFSMLLAVGAILTVSILAFHKPVLYLLGASDETYPFAGEYIRVYALGNIFVMITLGMNPFINSQGFGGTGMMTTLLGAVANIALDPIFIFKFGMGIKGAAIATVISQALSAAWVMKFLTGKQAALALKAARMTVTRRRAGQISCLGLSYFIMNMTSSLVQMVCNVTAQFYGGDIYVGVMTILNSIREIFILPLNGIASGAVPVMSFNYGSRAYGRVKRAIKFMTVAGVGYTALTWFAVFFFPTVFISLFTNDETLIAVSIPALRIYFFGFLLMSFHLIGQNAFVALGLSKQAIFFSTFRKVIVVTPLTLLLPRVMGLGVDGVFWAEPASNISSGVLCFATMMLVLGPKLRGGGEKPDAYREKPDAYKK